MIFKNFDDLLSLTRGKPSRVVVPGAHQDEVLCALKLGADAGLVSGGILIGDAEAVRGLAAKAGLDLGAFTLVPEPTPAKMCDRAAGLIHEGQGDFLMKGMVDTKLFLVSAMRRKHGLADEGATLSHFALFEASRCRKLFALADAAIMISPTLEEKRRIVQNCVDVMRLLGVETPRVAVVCPIEKVNPRIPSTVDAAELAKMSRDGRIRNAVVEGPYDLYIAFSRKLADEKGVRGGVVPGEPDIVLFADLDAANVAYKAISFFSEKCRLAGIVAGTRTPIVLPSRADDPASKMLSLALASFMKERASALNRPSIS